MEATLPLSYRLHSNPLRQFTSLGHKLTIVNRPNSIIFRHLHVMCGHQFRREAQAVNALEMNGGYKARGVVGASVALRLRKPMCGPARAYDPGSDKCLSHVKELVEKESHKRPLSKLEALLEMDRGEVENAQGYFSYCLMKEEFIHFNLLKDLAWKLELTDKLDGAVELLKIKFDEAIRTNSENAFRLGQLLVEMRIYQGDYKGAEDLCLDLEKFGEDSYQMVYIRIYQEFIELIISDDPKVFKEKATTFWKTHINECKLPYCPRDCSFNEFEVKVTNLRGKIEKKKPKT